MHKTLDDVKNTFLNSPVIKDFPKEHIGLIVSLIELAYVSGEKSGLHIATEMVKNAFSVNAQDNIPKS